MIKLFPLIIFSVLTITTFGQEKKIKEKREVFYTLIKDKEGKEKKRTKNFVDNVIKYDTLGREVEYILYGEVSHDYNDGAINCYWNYKNIKSIEKYYYKDNQKIADSTWYYYENKPESLRRGIEYLYVNKDTVPIAVREFDDKNFTVKTLNYEYDFNNNLLKRVELENEKNEITTTIYQYDFKNRIISEITTHNNLRGWKRTYDYIDNKNIKRKYFYHDINDLYPFSIQIYEYNTNKQLTRLFDCSTELPDINSKKLYEYKNGLLMSIETESYESKDGKYELIIYEYDFY